MTLSDVIDKLLIPKDRSVNDVSTQVPIDAPHDLAVYDDLLPLAAVI